MGDSVIIDLESTKEYIQALKAFLGNCDEIYMQVWKELEAIEEYLIQLDRTYGEDLPKEWVRARTRFHLSMEEYRSAYMRFRNGRADQMSGSLKGIQAAVLEYLNA